MNSQEMFDGIFTVDIMTEGRKARGKIYSKIACIIPVLILLCLINPKVNGTDKVVAVLLGGFASICFGVKGAVNNSTKEGVNLQGIRFTKDALETGSIFAQLDDPLTYKEKLEGSLKNIEWTHQEAYPLNDTRAVMCIRKVADGNKYEYVIGNIIIYQGENVVYDLKNARASNSLISNNLGVLSHNKLIKFDDAFREYNIFLSKQLKQFGQMQQGSIGLKPKWLYFAFMEAETSKLKAGVLGGFVGGAIAAGVDTIRQSRLNTKIQNKHYINDAFTIEFLPLLEEFQWEIRG